ncbi:MAG: alpha/beta hydrolase [Aliidiomarina sp.]|uniref:alpha/beta hydrolase n=1 Tax=Aliidiomarina sp. TaxID=1872439 RepID=UPI0025BFAA5E|nr:alpha/beta hydrolase [Aliidiomarina sp.]MCH8500748.1 alpha/beta hydrolase [Aliidiomarina sp.]
MKKQQLRRLIKFAIQPLFHPRVPFSLRRKLMKSAALLQRKQRGVQRDELILGGVVTYKAAAAHAGSLHILYLHGGGYVFGDVSTHRQIVDGLAVIGRATVWMPHYRLAPEKPFPAALDDAVAAYEALLDKAISPNDIIVAGDSAGGGLSVALAVRLRDEGVPLPRGLALFSPWVDLTVTRASHFGNAALDPMLLPSGLQHCAAAYCTQTPREHPLCSPLFADLQGLPRMLIQVGTDEILLDDAVELHKAAVKAGVSADLQVFEGMWHVFQLHCHQLPEATQAVKQALQALAPPQ